MTTRDKLTKAKIQLILTQPFFATLVLSLPLVENKGIETANVDGTKIQYNPDYIDSLNVDEIKGLLCHEILHVGNFHHTRRNGRDLETWNKAADYAINQLIVDCGMKLPKGALLSNDFKGMSAEQIFAKLPQPAPKDDPGNKPGGNQGGNGAPDPGKCGSVSDAPVQTQSEKQEIEAKVKQQFAQAAQAAKRAGNMPGFMQRMVDEILAPQINWKEVLARFVTDTARNDYSFRKPNPRFIQSGFYLPSLINEEPGRIVFIVDTSASIDKPLFNQFGSELQDVCSEVKSSLNVIYVDTEVQGMQEIEPDENIKLEAKGDGGTDFKPGFEYIDENALEPKAVIYLTDGECHSFPKIAPDYPVLWVKYGSYNFKPPFGEVIPIQ